MYKHCSYDVAQGSFNIGINNELKIQGPKCYSVY